MCVHSTNFALSIVPCCTGQCRIYFRHMHIVSCISLYILHILHTWCPLLSYHCTPPGVTHNIIVPCCTGQGGLRCGTSYRNRLQILQNWTLLYKFRVQRLHHALFSSPPTHWLVRNLHCISTMHSLYHLCCIQFIYCTSLCCAHLNSSSNIFT